MDHQMKRSLIHMIKFVGRQLPFSWLSGFSETVLLPFYHVVSDDPLPHVRSYSYPRVDSFLRDLDYLLRHYKPVGLDQVVTAHGLRRPLFHLSFDDGLRQCYDIIAPILLKKGIPATFFINPGFVDNKQLFHRYKAGLILTYTEKNPSAKDVLLKAGITASGIMKTTCHDSLLLDRIAEDAGVSFGDFLKQYRPYMTLSQIRELGESGFTIGGHSWDHPEFYSITEEEQFDQIRRSMVWIDENIQQEERVFAFPFTDGGIRTSLLRRVNEAGICEYTFGTAGLKRDIYPHHLQRLACETGMPLKATLKGELAYSGFRTIAGKSVVKRS